MKPFSPPDPAGMRDYFDVYLKHEAEMYAYVFDAVRKIPSLATVLQRLTPQQLEQQQQNSRSLMQKAVEGDWKPLLEDQRRQGATYAAMNIPFADWFELVGAFEKVFYPHLVNAYASDPPRLARVLGALSDYIDLGMSGIGEEYLKAKEKIIGQQAEAIRELSTPVLQVRDRLLLIPIIGVLDTHRARMLTEQLLRAVREHRAKVVVLDVTGVAAVDSRVANHLFQTVAAVKLMGAHSIITGLSAEVAQALVVLGIDVSRLTTAGDLQSGLEDAEHVLQGRHHDDAPQRRSNGSPDPQDG
jgi:rsbT co-antagonist protein RsbR